MPPMRTTVGPEEDDDLMIRFCAGDVDAFATLYDRYANSLFGLCVNLMQNRDEAEDALQETLLRVIDRRDSFEPRGRFRSWIFTVCRRICLERLRASKRSLAASEWRQLEAVAAPPDESMLHRSDLDRLLAVLLPEQREVLVLHFLHGFSYTEIGRITGAGESAAKQKAYRGLKALRSTTPSNETPPS